MCYREISSLVQDCLTHSHAIWPHRSGSTLAQVMACCLRSPSQWLNQCWLSITGVLWHSSESSFTRSACELNLWHRLDARPCMWPSILTLAKSLTLSFQGQILYLLHHRKNGSLATKQKQTYQLNGRPQMLPSILTLTTTLNLEFSRSNNGFAIYQEKWPNCHEMKNEHSSQMQGLKYGQEFWSQLFICHY